MSSYPVRGILQGFSEGSFTFEESVDLLNGFIKASVEKGYSHGVIDEMRRGRVSEQKSQRDWQVTRDMGM